MIKPLFDVLVNSTKLNWNYILDIVSIKDSNNLLKPGFNFPIVTKLGIESIELLFKIGVDFSELDNFNLTRIINQFGIDIIKQLFKIGVDFSKLTGSDISGIINKFGIESIDHLSSVNADFSKLDKNDIKEIIMEFSIESTELAIEGINLLFDIGVDFSKLDNFNLICIINKLGIESIKVLSAVDADFSKLDNLNLITTITELGIESIKVLSDVGVDFSKLKDPALKLIVEKELFVSKDLASEVREKISEYNEISLDKSIICENKGFNYPDICYQNDIENCLSCGHLANPSEDFLII